MKAWNTGRGDLITHVSSAGGNWQTVANWGAAQGGSTSSDESRQYMGYLRTQIDLPASTWFSPPPLHTYSTADEKAFIIHHALIQELLGNTDFIANDQSTRFVRIIRSETSAAVVPFSAGQSGFYTRRVNASGSVFWQAPGFSGAVTVTAVPHSRITGSYWLDRDANQTTLGFFLGNDENEFSYIAADRPAYYDGNNTNPKPTTPDSSQWEIQP